MAVTTDAGLTVGFTVVNAAGFTRTKHSISASPIVCGVRGFYRHGTVSAVNLTPECRQRRVEAGEMPAWEFRSANGAGMIVLSGEWLTRSNVHAPELARLWRNPAIRRVQFDTSRLGRWDTMLVAFLWDIKRAASASGMDFDDSGLPPSARELISLLPAAPRKPRAPPQHPLRPLSWIFTKAVNLLVEVGSSAVLVVETAAGSARLFLGRARFRGVDLLVDLLNAGPRAMAIVGTVNFLVGAILAFIGAAELRQYAAQTYVPNLVGVASVRELSSVVTAIVMAGRSGGAYAARIATMQGNDEIAALRVLGIPISEFLILPAVVSLCVAMPILYLCGCCIAIVGGLAVSVVSLGFTAAHYLRETLDAVSLSDFVFGAIKSIAFAALIGAVSCQIGLKAARNARAVGDAATGAVVANILGIIALDAVFAVMMDANGI
jgi:phospholipid/cholesterol/gamma-HCH transport system permease protein